MSALSGDLSVFHPVDVMQFLGFVRARGALVLLQPGRRARVFFEDGRITGVEGAPSRPRIGELLKEGGLVSEPQIEAGLKRTEQSGARLGEALVELNSITQGQLENALEDQLSRGLFQLLRWQQGSFEFRPGITAGESLVLLKTSLDRLLFESLKRLDEEDAELKGAAHEA